jgi:hypothetical protein|tara:strand:- start:1158 stop:1448 length:291 start_codon:yes stop_codon:yes gene_type:complete
MVIDVVRPVETSRDVRRASGSFRSVLRSSRLAREREGRRRVTRRWTDGLMMMIDADRHQSNQSNQSNPAASSSSGTNESSAESERMDATGLTTSVM